MKTNIPFTVIGGYLGAGKTTLLNHILRHSDGQRFTLLINDFGDINIDAELIESQDDKVIKLSNGCICCSLAGEFFLGINAILEQDPLPDRVIVEASGVSNPTKIAPYGQTPGFSLDSILVVADAETVQDKAGDKYVGRTVVQQLKSADLILLNKTDLVNHAQKQDVRAWLQAVAPDARILEATHGVVPLPLLLGLYDGGKSDRAIDPDHHHHPGDEYEIWSFTSEQPLDGNAFRSFVKTLPEGVLRSKGILYLQENPQERYIFQLVGKRWSIKAGDPWEDKQPATRLVMIGLSGWVDLAWLENNLKMAIGA